MGRSEWDQAGVQPYAAQGGAEGVPCSGRRVLWRQLAVLDQDGQSLGPSVREAVSRPHTRVYELQEYYFMRCGTTEKMVEKFNGFDPNELLV